MYFSGFSKEASCIYAAKTHMWLKILVCGLGGSYLFDTLVSTDQYGISQIQTGSTEEEWRENIQQRVRVKENQDDQGRTTEGALTLATKSAGHQL